MKNEESCSHLNSPIATSANNLISHKVYTIHFIRMASQISLELVRLQIPYLHKGSDIFDQPMKPLETEVHTLTVLSLLALTNNLESALHVTR